MKLNPGILISTVLASLLFSFTGLADAQAGSNLPGVSNDSTGAALLKPQKVVTHGIVTVEGKQINYDAVAGTIVLKNDEDQPTCSMFYAAYFKSGVKDPAQRPLTFIYNGGPGSSTIWLHMGAFGPQRVDAADTARVLPPYKTVNNDYSLLDASDLVFIDAPATGLSRIIGKDMGGAGKAEDFFGTDQDASAFTHFIMDFLTAFNRWNSPKYLFGESYGTYRSAAVSYKLQVEEGVDLNGIILLSQILNFDNMTDFSEANPGVELPYQLALPSFAATAWYHHKLPDRPEKLEPFLHEVEDFAMNDYALALGKGSDLDSATANEIANRLHAYTGLSVPLIRKARLRITGPVFDQNLMSGEDKIAGRLDSRFLMYNPDPLSKKPVMDPLDAGITSIFLSTANNYIHTVLGYGADRTIKPLSNIFLAWDFRHKVPGFPIKLFPNTMPDLALSMAYNPRMKVMLNMGYFDLATPYYEGLYEMKHLAIDPSLQKNISYAYYMSGHMVYLRIPSLKRLHDNVATFINETH